MDEDKLYLKHIIEAALKIKEYTEGMTLEDFKKNAMAQDAVVREFEIIGEAARHVSETTRKRYSDVPWFEISGMRNKLIHEYFGVDLQVVWKTMTKDLPLLLEKLMGNNQ